MLVELTLKEPARASAREYCPVSPDYNPSDFVKKSEIDLQNQCPKLPDLKDYVLKSTIPPVQKCPSCVCPKVKVSAGMCKKCPEPKIIVHHHNLVDLNNVKMLLNVVQVINLIHALNVQNLNHVLNQLKKYALLLKSPNLILNAHHHNLAQLHNHV